LEKLVRSESAQTLTALAKTTGIPLATCAAIMQTLEARDYATRTIIGRSHLWRATLKINGLAAELVDRIDMADFARPHLQRLVGDLPVAAHLGVLEGDHVIYVAKAGSKGMVQFNTFPGKTTPYHLTALGRAIAAHLPEDRVKPLIQDRPPGSGPGSRPTDPESLLEVFETVRKRGYATEMEEEDADLGCIAAPYFDAHGEVAGAIGVTGFAHALKGKQAKILIERIVTEAARLSSSLRSGSDQI
jgi:DNA-binding IclR family transcriptional regulator